MVQVRLTDGVRYRGHGKARRFHRSHGQADTVYCDRAFFNDIAKDRRICMNGVPDSRIVFRILAMRPTPSTWPATMCPPKRPLAGMARSRLTALPTVSCASAERFKVSCMTSAAKLSGKSCLTVRQMPLTAMLSPILVPSRTVLHEQSARRNAVPD